MPQLDIVIFQIEYICFVIMFYVLFDLISFYILPIIFRNIYIQNLMLNFLKLLAFKSNSVFSYLNKIEYPFISFFNLESFVRRMSLYNVILRFNKTFCFPLRFFEMSATWKNTYYYFLFTILKSNHYILMYPYFKGLDVTIRKLKFRKIWPMLLTFYLKSFGVFVNINE